jgi:dTDP-4-amino-4,6-dideoxy-D-galactose acyltransferase
MTNVLCKVNDLDTKIFNFRVANVNKKLITLDEMFAIDKWCNENEIEVLCALVDLNSYATTQLFENSGFDFVGIKVVLENKDIKKAYPLPSWPKQWKHLAGIRPSRPTDKTAVKAIAREINKSSRFFFDPHFCAKAPSLYEAWIENSFNGYADEILVAEINDEIAGYITIKRENDKGEIDLLGVNGKYQGIGLGYGLICKSFEWFLNKGIEDVVISTQGKNIKAIRLYEKVGFSVQSILGWYHQIRQTRND